MYIGKDGKEVEVSSEIDQTYRILEAAAARINENVTKALYAKHGDLGRCKFPLYSPTETHRAIVDAMPKVLSGEMSVGDALALVHSYDGDKERLGASWTPTKKAKRSQG